MSDINCPRGEIFSWNHGQAIANHDYFKTAEILLDDRPHFIDRRNVIFDLPGVLAVFDSTFDFEEVVQLSAFVGGLHLFTNRPVDANVSRLTRLVIRAFEFFC